MATKKVTMTNDQIRDEISIRKQLLAQTDYQCLKFAEGSISEEDYKAIRDERQAWRDEINALEAQITSED